MSFDTTPVLETEYAEATTKDTAWVSLALDFRSASAEELALPGEREEDNTMWKMVQHFKAASLNLLEKLKAKVPQTCRAISGYGISGSGKIDSR